MPPPTKKISRTTSANRTRTSAATTSVVARRFAPYATALYSAIQQAHTVTVPSHGRNGTSGLKAMRPTTKAPMTTTATDSG